jgi:GntR family transcriptional repressor for pyruvate dehydrogenase complex
MRRVRSFDEVHEHLREAIFSGRIRPGERLPAERDLCEELGVGRPTLREALRSLESAGMIEVRPGKGGGSYAATPSESTVGDALAALVNLRGASLEDLAEFRVDFEGENAAWAARRADAADITALEALAAEARDRSPCGLGSRGVSAQGAKLPRAIAQIDVNWHEAVARATKNRLRIGIALGIHEAVMRRHRALLTPDAHADTIPGEIAAITAAVAAGDPEGARRLMREHIEAWNRRTTGA